MILCLSLPCFSQAFQNLFHIRFHIHWTLFSVPLKNSLFLPSKTLTDLFLFATCTWNAFIILQHMHVSSPCMLVTRETREPLNSSIMCTHIVNLHHARLHIFVFMCCRLKATWQKVHYLWGESLKCVFSLFGFSFVFPVPSLHKPDLPCQVIIKHS